MKMNVPMLPLSQPNAVGLILAHGKKNQKKQLLVLSNGVINRSHHSCLCLQEVSETQNLFSPLMCTCLMTAATRGYWPSKAPIITLYWTLEGCWWRWSTPTPLSIRSSQLNWERATVVDLFSGHHRAQVFLLLSPSRFSTDEGQCWHGYNFTSDPFHFVSMDSEPGSRSMNISLWGYRTVFTKWVVITVDFRQLFTQDCEYSGASRC